MKKQRTVQKHNSTGTVILTIILIAVLGFATYWVAVNYETVKATFNGTKLYTQKEVTDAYNKGVEDKASYEKQITDWMTSYETANAQLKEVTRQLDNYKKVNAEDKAKIEEMEATITKLNGDISYYKALIEQYKDLNKRIISFYNGDEIVKSYAVDKDTVVTEVPTITDTNHIKFKGWSIDGTNIIDPTTITVSDDVKFIAVFEYYAKVQFMVDNEEYFKQFVKLNDTATLPNEPTKQYYNFIGWSVDGTNVIDPTVTAVNDDIKFIAVFEQGNYIIYKDFDGYVYGIEPTAESTDFNLQTINCPINKSEVRAIYVPNGFTTINLSQMFANIEEIKLPETLIKIESYAFGDCKKLTTITIPTSVKTIGHGAFKNVNTLTITYKGSLALWNNIEKTVLNNNSKQSITLVCSDTTIKID